MVPRVLNSHIPPGLTRQATDLIVQVDDEPGPGGACHRYLIASNEPEPEDNLIDCGPAVWTRIDFQNGPIHEEGVNGVTIEALLAVCVDRLEGFQSGQFACQPNQEALDHLRAALTALHGRTLDRVARQVEGKSQL